MFDLSQTNAKMLLDNVDDMIRIISDEGKVVYANEAFKRKIAENRETVGEHCYELYGEEGECGSCAVRETFALGTARHATRDFKNKKYAVNISPIINEAGEVVAVMEVFKDQTLHVKTKKEKDDKIAKMEHDFHLARKMQNALVKNAVPTAPGYTFYSAFIPTEKVGGDIFDNLSFGNKMVMYVADVSGHGVMQAMLGVFFSRAVKTACSLGILVPSEIFKYVQKEFETLDLDDAIYITAFLVVLNTYDGSFLYSNAGLSVVPIVYDGKITELEMSSLPISTWFPEPVFEDSKGSLAPGARLLLYTDGINNIHRDREVSKKLYQMFSEEPFSAQHFKDQITATLHTKQEDDFTMLICSRDKTDRKA